MATSMILICSFITRCTRSSVKMLPIIFLVVTFADGNAICNENFIFLSPCYRNRIQDTNLKLQIVTSFESAFSDRPKRI